MNELSIYKPAGDLPSEWKTFLADASAEAQNAYKDFFYERDIWKKISEETTPLNILKEREGSKKDGIAQILEYFPEEYTITELNRLFPGWWTDDMKRSPLEEIVALQTVIVEGYLMVSYPVPSGIKIRKLWTVAGSKVQFLKDTKIPVDLADNFKGARTEWIRIAGKWLGIGLDIYHQRITEPLRSMFEDICRSLDVLSEFKEDETLSAHVNKLKAIAGTLETGHGFRNFLKEQQTPQQIKRFRDAIKPLPQAKQAELWKHFIKFNNKSEQSTTQVQSWLQGLETKMDKIKDKLNNKGD